MSRGFVKEDDLEHAGTDLPERPISAQINYVTVHGLAQLKASVESLFAARALLLTQKDDATAQQKLAMVERDLRYFSARISSAILVEQPTLNQKDSINGLNAQMQSNTKNIVLFGATVTVQNDEDVLQTMTIVGEDEADISAGKISWNSPLAKALIGQKIGDTVVWKRPVGDAELTIIAIAFEP